MDYRDQSARQRPPLGRLAALAFGAFATVTALSGCKSETLFRSNFDATPADSPPAPAQAVGTAAIDGPAGSVMVVVVPGPDGEPNWPGHWVQITRANGPGAPIAGFQGNFSKFGGEGEYTFATTLIIPSGSGAATIQCEPFGQPVSQLARFLHIDFLPTGAVRVDDNPSKIVGTCPHDRPFLVQVRLKIGTSSGTANIALGGDGATGEATFDLDPTTFVLARQFGAVRVFMGFPSVGTVNAANISVARTTN